MARRLGPRSLGYLSQTLTTFAGQNYLLSLWLDNPKMWYGPPPMYFSCNGMERPSSTNQHAIYRWTNLQFVVTATSPSTVLQFGFETPLLPWA